jgi:NADH-quinone oxidoreductase subunit N
MEKEFLYGLPVVLITVLSVVTILVDAFSGSNKKFSYYFNIVALLIVGAAAAYTLTIPQAEITGLNSEQLLSKGQLTFGGYAAILDIVFVLAGIFTLIAANPYLRREFDVYKEFYSLIVFAINGMVIIAHSNNLLVMFLGIEIMSVTFYVLAGFIRTRITAIEAALKYFLLGAFASGFLVYGMAMIYGSTGSLDLNVISNAIVYGDIDLLYFQIGIGLLIVGLSFKVAAFPFHQWAPDVYHGSPTIVTGFMSTAGKAAAIIAFVIIGKNLLHLNFDATVITEKALEIQNINETALLIIAFISAATMLIGNISALVQKNVKRMLAYSSVAHAGYLMMGIVANNSEGWSGILFYATAYMFMQVGAFVIVGVIERKEDQNMNLTDYSGLRKSHPYLAAMMAIFMFSLAGLPPFAGFPGKYMLFLSVIESGYTWLTIVAVVSSIISMYFYIGLIVFMYFKERDGEPLEADAKGSMIPLYLTVAGVFILGIFPGYLLHLGQYFFSF